MGMAAVRAATPGTADGIAVLALPGPVQLSADAQPAPAETLAHWAAASAPVAGPASGLFAADSSPADSAFATLTSPPAAQARTGAANSNAATGRMPMPSTGSLVLLSGGLVMMVAAAARSRRA